jgi:hypothetical protein
MIVVKPNHNWVISPRIISTNTVENKGRSSGFVSQVDSPEGTKQLINSVEVKALKPAGAFVCKFFANFENGGDL